MIGLPHYKPITEDHPTRPIRAYQASKLFGEHLVNIAADEGMNAASLRITAPVGSGTPKNRIMSVFVERAMTGQPLILAGRGARQQNYVDVRDVASAVELCLDKMPIGVMNIAGDGAVTNANWPRPAFVFSTPPRVLDLRVTTRRKVSSGMFPSREAPRCDRIPPASRHRELESEPLLLRSDACRCHWRCPCQHGGAQCALRYLRRCISRSCASETSWGITVR